MNFPIVFPKNHRSRVVTVYEKTDPRIPKRLFARVVEQADLSDIKLPLPAAKKDYTVFAPGDDGVIWMGTDNAGLTRYAPNEARKEDIVQYFAADHELPDNKVRSLWAEGHNVWVQTETGVSFIEMREMTVEEKIAGLTKETLTAIDRHGMITQKTLEKERDISSAVPYGHSDNDGGFTAEFAIGEMLRYHCMATEKGADSPDAKEALKVATRAYEAVLLLTYIHGRGDGFISRSYVTTSEPVPDDGLFFKKENGKATCLDTRHARRKGIANKVIDASAPVPDRLAALYRSEGYTDDDIIYKGDTSSDELTGHFLAYYFAHKILGPVDPELDELIKTSVRATMQHILDHGYEMWECNGEPTTWAKYSPRYFATEMAYADAALNSAMLLMYLKATMYILGEEGHWKEEHDKLVEMGYADLPVKHYDRFYQVCSLQGIDIFEDLMYGDHGNANLAFWGLFELEHDPVLRKKYVDGYKTWRTSIAREHNPYTDFVFMLGDPDMKIDASAIATWFLRGNASMLDCAVGLFNRRDVPKRILRGGYEETDWLLPPDERMISKFDRNYWWYKEIDFDHYKKSKLEVESCYYYTLPYWMGRYYGFIASPEA